MFNNNVEDKPLPKRPLTKMRRPFLHRASSELDISESIDTDQTSSTNGLQINVLSKCLGLVEVNKKILISLQYLNSFSTINHARIENLPNQKAVTLNVAFNSDNNVPSWEEAAKRLESYEDEQLSGWAVWMRNHYLNHTKVMTNYFEYLNSKDPQACIDLRKAKKRAVLMCREIESKYSFRKLLVFAKRDSTELLSVSYSEGILKELGHTPEGFLLWTKYNGLPGMFDKDCPEHLQIARNFFDFKSLKKGEFVSKGEEYIVNLEDKNGKKHKILAQYIHILDPTEEGIFLSGYFIIKDQPRENGLGLVIKESGMQIEEAEHEEIEGSLPGDKQDKMEEEILEVFEIEETLREV